MNSLGNIFPSKRAFLTYELGLLTLKAALSTRDDVYPVYARQATPIQRAEAKEAIRAILPEIESRYDPAAAPVDESAHVEFVSAVSDRLSDAHGHALHGMRFRIGIAQKLVNLHLKYLWSAGLASQPHHCPLDGIVRDMAQLRYDWTSSDSIEEYVSAIADLRLVAGERQIAVWELEVFRRRAQ
jgi:hypothetical protein